MRLVAAAPFTLFLLSPANLSGPRAKLVFNPAATFPLARQLHSPEGAPLGQVFSFVSGLYFRGKMAYAEAFGRPPPALSGGLVISPAEGLRFLHEPVTLPRLQAWAKVDIDERNPRFTAPLLEHASLLQRTLGETTRFVLLGSVATDKYVQPLTQVFGERLLFPPEFSGRGDMSRGSLLLRAARENAELVYAPLLRSARHGSRARPRVAAPAAPFDLPLEVFDPALELIMLIGLPGAGKSTFFRQRFAGTHGHVSKDDFRSHRRPSERQDELIRRALSAGRSIVVDNTNVTVEERALLITLARRFKARVVGYYFDSTTRECLARNRLREGKARVADVGIFALAKRLARPESNEGFDELHWVKTRFDQGFEVSRAAS